MRWKRKKDPQHKVKGANISRGKIKKAFKNRSRREVISIRAPMYPRIDVSDERRGSLGACAGGCGRKRAGRYTAEWWGGMIAWRTREERRDGADERDGERARARARARGRTNRRKG